jgi:hypothetical protein
MIGFHDAQSTATPALEAILAATSDTRPGDPAEPHLNLFEVDSWYKAAPIVGPTTAPRPLAMEKPAVRFATFHNEPHCSDHAIETRPSVRTHRR